MRFAHGEVGSMLIAQHLAPLLAATESEHAFAGNATFYIVAIVVPVLGLALTIAALILSSKRNPPVGEEMHKTFVPRAEWDASVQRLHTRIDESHERIAAGEATTAAKIDSLRTDMTKVFQDVERGLGRVEGKLGDQR